MALPFETDEKYYMLRMSLVKAQELYDQLKLPEDVVSGDYANAVMIGHTATEFSFSMSTAHRLHQVRIGQPRSGAS